MSQSPAQISRLPLALTYPLRFVPLAPLSTSLTLFARKTARNHPALFRRLGVHGQKRFVLDPTDLPFVILLDPNGGTPKVTVIRGSGAGAARIAGPLAALIGLVHGVYDGDALFFSRDLVIEGETAATLALRNAVDDAELDLSQELLNLSGPLARPLQHMMAFWERHSGVHLTRPDEVETW